MIPIMAIMFTERLRYDVYFVCSYQDFTAYANKILPFKRPMVLENKCSFHWVLILLYWPTRWYTAFAAQIAIYFFVSKISKTVMFVLTVHLPQASQF